MKEADIEEKTKYKCHKGRFINGVIFFGGYARFSLQTSHVYIIHIHIYNVLSIHGWSEVKPPKMMTSFINSP